jgi:hypothetical protein
MSQNGLSVQRLPSSEPFLDTRPILKYILAVLAQLVMVLRTQLGQNCYATLGCADADLVFVRAMKCSLENGESQNIGSAYAYFNSLTLPAVDAFTCPEGRRAPLVAGRCPMDHEA